jgi:hypothetical protein
VKEQSKNLVKALANLTLGVGAVGLNAYVLTLLYGWFVVSVFGGPAVSVVVMLGLHILYRTFVSNTPIEVKAVEDHTQAAIDSILVSLIGLCIGYLIHLMM